MVSLLFVEHTLVSYCAITVLGVESVMRGRTGGTDIMPDIKKLTRNFGRSPRFGQQ